VPVEWVALREGRMRFEDGIDEALPSGAVNVIGNGRCKKHLLAWPGRLGIKAPVSLINTDISELQTLFNSTDSRPLLVLGSGECNAPAYLLGRELERRGYRVKVQSTTRSPIHPGNDIASVCRFKDNYDDGIDNFIYNVNPGVYQTIILCHETPLSEPLQERLDAWRAIGARIAIDPSTGHAKLYFSRPG
jgi:hypothetical protein